MFRIPLFQDILATPVQMPLSILPAKIPSSRENLPNGHIHDWSHHIFSSNCGHWYDGVTVSHRHADETNMILTSDPGSENHHFCAKVWNSTFKNI
jgi:hypothetical protein